MELITKYIITITLQTNIKSTLEKIYQDETFKCIAISLFLCTPEHVLKKTYLALFISPLLKREEFIEDIDRLSNSILDRGEYYYNQGILKLYASLYDDISPPGVNF